MTKTEILRVQKYLRDKFATERFVLRERKEDQGSVEVLLGGEFLGVIYRDADEGEISYDFNMAILEADLPNAA